VKPNRGLPFLPTEMFRRLTRVTAVKTASALLSSASSDCELLIGSPTREREGVMGYMYLTYYSDPI
jgi:hypothetical protein